MDTILLLVFIIILFLYLIEKKSADDKYYKDDIKQRVNQVNVFKEEKTSINQAPLNYKKLDHLLTPGELKFYRVLSKAIDESNYYICPKVRLADIVMVNNNNKWQTYFNKIKSKHIDFVLCDKKTMAIIKAIELDDKSHMKKNRQERDYFINKTFHDVGIPLIRYPMTYSYEVEDIKNKLKIY